MKNLFFTSILLLFSSTILLSQSASGGCSSVTVTSYLPVQQLYFSNGTKPCSLPNVECCRLLTNPFLLGPQYELEKKQTNGSWQQIGTAIYEHEGNNSFTSLANGIYRVKITSPSANLCPNDPSQTRREAYTQSGQFLGFEGAYFYGQNVYGSYISYTNEVLVGATDFTDKNISFLDYNGNLGQFVYDEGDQIDISTINCKDYNRYFLAVFEDGSQSRYKSTGWVNSTLPHPFDLSAFWSSNNFIDGNTYELQLVIGNKECNVSPNPMWSDTDEFSICPFGTGCRIVEDRSISIFPTPAATILNINHNGIKHELSYAIYSLNGQILQHKRLNQRQIDVSSFVRGTYIVQILNGKDVLKTQKVSFI